MQKPILEGLKLLIVENDPLNAQLIIGGTALVAAAMLDYRLYNETVEPVAAWLEAGKVPYIIVTGALPPDFAQRFPRARALLKPYTTQQLIDVLNASLAQ